MARKVTPRNHMVLTFDQAEDYYMELEDSAIERGELKGFMAAFAPHDLYYLLTRILRRPDIIHPWLYARCREVQLRPNGMLDLWARGHGKSSIITFGHTFLDIIRNPAVTIGLFSHTRGISKAFLGQIKDEMEQNSVLHELWPDIFWADPKKNAPRWSLDTGIVVKRKNNPKEQTVEAWGLVDGQPTSRHFDVLCYDDVVTRESVTTPEQMQKVTEAWALSLNLGSTHGVQRYIGTRYHFNDTYRSIIARNAATPRIHTATVDNTLEGEPVFMSRKMLDEKRAQMGSFVYAAQMFQDPRADQVQGFNLDDLRHWRVEGTEAMNRYIVVDPASEKKRTSDYTVILVIGLAEDQNYYLIDGIRDRLSLTERAQALFRLHRKYRPLATGYEKYGQQADIEHMQDVMTRENYRFNITPLGGAVSKNDRIRKLIPLFEAGRFWLPDRCLFVDYGKRGQDLTRLFIDEMDGFPVGEHDDILDAAARIVDPAMGAVFPEPNEIEHEVGIRGLVAASRAARTTGVTERYNPYA